MPIIYALVGMNKTILAEHTDTKTKGNFQNISKQILEKTSSKNVKVSYEYDAYMFHLLVENSVIFLCMADKEFKNRIPFNFLEDIKQRFFSQYPNALTQFKQALPYSLNRDFGRVLQTQMAFFSDPQKSDKITSVKGQLKEVKDIMIDNIERVLDRGEKIELLVEASEGLADSAQDFKFKSKKLKTSVWCKNFKLILLLIFIVLVILFGVIWLICGIPFFQTCRSWFEKKE